MKMTILAGAAALLLVLGLPLGASADDNNVTIDDTVDDVWDDDNFRNADGNNNVSTNVLGQVVTASAHQADIVDGTCDCDTELHDDVMRNATGVFNFNTQSGVNQAQAGQVAISASASTTIN